MTTEIQRRLSRLTRPDEPDTLAQLLAAQQSLHHTVTEAIDRLSRRPKNTVLLNELIVVPDSGVVSRAPGSGTIGSALVFNYTADDVICSGGPPAATAPTQGIGVTYIPVGTWLAMPVDDLALTVYAPGAGKITMQLFTGMIAYGSGSIG